MDAGFFMPVWLTVARVMPRAGAIMPGRSAAPTSRRQGDDRLSGITH
jgi:hypothetical protein